MKAMETIKTYTKDAAVNTPCAIRKGYRFVIYDIQDNIVSINDYYSLDFALFWSGSLVYDLRQQRNVAVYREELYCIENFEVVKLKKTYNF